MDEWEAIEFTLVVALALSAVHVFSPRIREWARGRVEVIEPLGAGALAAYIFLHLLPSLGAGEAEYGLAASAVVLGGFITYYGFETFVAERPGHMMAVRVAMGWLYSFVIVYSLPGTVEESPLAAVISAFALALHVVQADNRMAWERPEPFDRWIRWVLASAPLVAVGLDAALGAPSDRTATYFSAFASGMLLLGLFRDELGERHHRRAFPLFLIGLGGYGAILLAEEIVRHG